MAKPKPKPKPISIKKPRLLVVEGSDEKRLFKALLAHIKKSGIKIDAVQVIDAEGKGKIKSNIQVIANESNFSTVSSIGIVRDADHNAADALISVQDALRSAKLPVPNAPLIVERDEVRKVAVLITPYGKSSGMLEDVCLEAMEDDPAMDCVKEYFSCIKSRLDEQAQPNNLSKAMMQVFLASRPRSGLSLGITTQKRGYWDFEHPAFEPLKRLVGMLQ